MEGSDVADVRRSELLGMMERREQIERIFDERFMAARAWCPIADILRDHSLMVARAARTVAEQMVRDQHQC